MPRHALLHTVVAFFVCCPLSAAEPDKKPAFNADIRPIFKAHCTECHGEVEKPKGGLDLRLKRSTLRGGKSGPAVLEGDPEKSLLLDRVTSGEMPPGQKKLSAAEIATLRKWIAAGAKVEAPEPEVLALGFVITDSDRKWWAFQPVKRSNIPVLSNQSAQIATPIDSFLQ